MVVEGVGDPSDGFLRLYGTKFLLRVPDGEVDSLLISATVVHNLVTLALWASEEDMHRGNGERWVVGWLGEC